MADVWERVEAVATRRIGALAAIALGAVWLPGLVQLATRTALVGGGPATAASPGAGAAVALLGIATSLLAIVGMLAIVAIGSDPALTAAEALRVGVRRLLPMVGLSLLLGLALVVLTLPIVALVPGLATMQPGTAPTLGEGASVFVRWYSVALVVLLLWAEARLVLPLSPVVVNERLGWRSLVRAWQLTRRLTWRLIGAVLLFALVAGVAVLAARSVAGVAAWLLLGGDRPLTVAFVASAAASLVATGFAAAAGVFAGQLYLALVGEAAPLVPVRPRVTAATSGAAPAKAGPWG